MARYFQQDPEPNQQPFSNDFAPEDDVPVELPPDSAYAQPRTDEVFLEDDELLTEEEQEVFRRGRNTSPHTVPAHAKREDYAAATALETLFGWLWLKGETGRLNQLFETIMEETQWP